MGIVSLGEWWPKSNDCWCGDAIIFCAAWNADLSWPVLRDVMKSSPSPTQRSTKTRALALSSSGLSWESISPKWHTAPGVPGGHPLVQHRLGSLLWGTGLVMWYRERAGWDGGRLTVECLEEEEKVGRWGDQAILGRNKCAKMEREDRGDLLTVCWLTP